MNTVLSPMQPSNNYLTREEFRDHDQYMRDGFDKVFEQVDNVETTIITRINVLEVGVNKRFDGIDVRFDSMDTKFDGIDARFDSIDARFETIDAKFDDVDKKFVAVDRRFDAIDKQLDSINSQLGLFTKITTKLVEKLG